MTTLGSAHERRIGLGEEIRAACAAPEWATTVVDMAGSGDAATLLRSLMENVPGAIYRAANDSDWTNQRVSDEIETITGYPAADFLGASKRTIVAVTHPDDREPVAQEIAAALAEGRPFALEYRIMHADGGIRWVLERGVKTIDRYGAEWLDGIIFDITERRAAEHLRIERELEAVHVAELEASRARMISAADAARRRIERELHDGAQQRLAVASLHLRAAESTTDADSDAAASLQAARADLDAGIAELRELARGIHPAVLTDFGLSPALEALAGRCAVAVGLDDAVGPRLSPAIETALYYSVSEALTNVDRYAGASRAIVRLRRLAGSVEVEVADDGRGGADRGRGSGLRGLEDRLGAVNGVLELDSPPGGGTRLRVCVPVDARTIAA
jgi:PAS domain S-box-containing protein